MAPTDYTIPDPPLTILGADLQCATLRAALKQLPLDIDLIVSSPMRRTLQTTTNALGWRIAEGIPAITLAEFQENSAKPCDTGSDPQALAAAWPAFDWSALDPAFPAKTGLYEFSKEGLTRRGEAARRWLRAREEKVVAVVSHAGFLRVGVSYCAYDNADFRIFEFAEGEEEGGGRLVEWALTEERGGGLGKSEKGVFGWETQRFPEEKERKADEGVPAEDAQGLGEVKVVS
ncbi:hypothetical protein VE03_00373 [Pseudogymnoascus sp. 23342-1-I1]|nr:hypothetical protein VE03_00373 [Pseudogymnoascus sp. 23342-1-I1]